MKTRRIVLDMEDGMLEYFLEQFELDEDGKKYTPSLRIGKSGGCYAEFVEEGYLIDNLEEKLRKIRDGLSELKRNGFTKKLLEAYVRSKGVNKADYEKVMYAIEDFFRQLK